MLQNNASTRGQSLATERLDARLITSPVLPLGGQLKATQCQPIRLLFVLHKHPVCWEQARAFPQRAAVFTAYFTPLFLVPSVPSESTPLVLS